MIYFRLGGESGIGLAGLFHFDSFFGLGALALGLAHAQSIPQRFQVLLADFIFRRLCSMLKSVHSAVSALNRL